MQTNEQALEVAANAVVTAFGPMVFADITDERKAEMLKLIQNVAANFRGYTTHWEIYISSVSQSFHFLERKFKEWLEGGVFADRLVLRQVAITTAEHYIEREREHASAHVRGQVAKLMAALGFYEDALGYYRDACERSYRELTGQGRASMAEELRTFLAVYRASGQKIAALDKAVEQQVTRIKDESRDSPSGHWVGVRWEWFEHPARRARRHLAELGFSKAEIDQRLPP